MSGQKHTHSWIEALTNALTGALVAYTAQLIVFPWLGVVVTQAQHYQITIIFTCISTLRSYIFRRIFNWFQIRTQEESLIGFKSGHKNNKDYSPNAR